MESLGNIVLYFAVSLIIIVFSVMAVKTRKILRADHLFAFCAYRYSRILFSAWL